MIFRQVFSHPYSLVLASCLIYMAVILSTWFVLTTMAAVTTTRITMDPEDEMETSGLQSEVEDKLEDVLDYLEANRDDLIWDTIMGVALAAEFLEQYHHYQKSEKSMQLRDHSKVLMKSMETAGEKKTSFRVKTSSISPSFTLSCHNEIIAAK